MGRHALKLTYRTVEIHEITLDDFIMDANKHKLESVKANPGDQLELIRLRHPMRTGNAQGVENTHAHHKRVAELHGSQSNEVSRRKMQTDSLLSSGSANKVDCERILNELNKNRFDCRYIQVDAGEQEAYFLSIVEEMKREPSELHKSIQPFLNVKSTPLKSESDQQSKAKVFFDAVQRKIWTDHPSGGKAHNKAFQPVFLSLGRVYVRHHAEGEGQTSAPRLDSQTGPFGIVTLAEIDQSKNKPDWLLDLFRSTPIDFSRSVYWKDFIGIAESKLLAVIDCTTGLILQVQRYQASLANDLRFGPQLDAMTDL